MPRMRHVDAIQNTGQWVTYKNGERGQITTVSSRYVFVKFEGDYASKACSAEDLELIRGPQRPR